MTKKVIQQRKKLGKDDMKTPSYRFLKGKKLWIWKACDST